MATHDYVIANQSGASFRTDLNNALAAIVSNNSNSSEPSTMYAYQWWADTSANILKLRNSSNNAWISICNLDGTIIADRVVTASIADDAITQALVANDAIGADELASNAVVNASVASDAAIAGSKIAPDFGSQTITTTGTVDTPSIASGQLGNRNIVINGAMQIAQRGTSSTTSGMSTVDRFLMGFAGHDEALTQAQVDVSSGTTPYTLGFRKALKITNGNQTSGFGSADYFQIQHKIEAQDIAQSGWNYNSSSSFVTLSFWIKSSVAQNFYGYLKSQDGTFRRYVYETGSLTADTWTKITKTIPGNSGITFNNDNGEGLILELIYFSGSDETGSVSLNSWATFNSSSRTPANTSTWWTTNDSTLEITGVQLEVSTLATNFEHKSFSQDLTLCKRYFQQYPELPSDGFAAFGPVATVSTTQAHFAPTIPTMRAAPTVSLSGNARLVFSSGISVTSLQTFHTSASTLFLGVNVASGLTSGNAGTFGADNDSTAKLTFSAEL
tara:strand:+ start:904 stop:2403 length:1500 start_codon:yes stop_codon:yes gene_type:complete